MIHICKADHFRSPAWVKKLRALVAHLFNPIIRCAECGKGFDQSEHMWSLGPNCRVYHDRCVGIVAGPGFVA